MRSGPKVAWGWVVQIWMDFNFPNPEMIWHGFPFEAISLTGSHFPPVVHCSQMLQGNKWAFEARPSIRTKGGLIILTQIIDLLSICNLLSIEPTPSTNWAYLWLSYIWNSNQISLSSSHIVALVTGCNLSGAGLDFTLAFCFYSCYFIVNKTLSKKNFIESCWYHINVWVKKL